MSTARRITFLYRAKTFDSTHTLEWETCDAEY
jgi:hypothetical protein